MRRLFPLGLLLLLLLVLLIGAVPTPTHLLAWETQAVAATVAVEQCANLAPRKGGCVFTLAKILPGTIRQWDTGPLPRNRSFCWRVRPQAPAQAFPWSNIVCT